MADTDTTETPDSSESHERQESVMQRTMAESILDAEAKNADYEAQYGYPALETNPQWHQLGTIRSYEQTHRGLIVSCDQGFAELVWLAPDCLRVRIQPDSGIFQEPFSYAVAKTDWPPVERQVKTRVNDEQLGEIALQIQCGAYLYDILSPFSVSVSANQGMPDSDLLYCEDAVMWSTDGQSRLTFLLTEDEACYGLGERAFDVNLRGRVYQLWNTDPGGYQRGDEPINYCIPFYVGAFEQGVYGVLWDNPTRGFADIGASNELNASFQSEAGEICYYIFTGGTLEAVIQRYTELTGRAPMPPMWALGYHQCRYSYMTQEEVLQVARELRQRQLPCDVIYLDIDYMDGYRVFTWDSERFPDPKAMSDELRAMGFKLVVILDPGVKVDMNYHAYATGLDDGIFMMYPDGTPAEGVVWPGLTHHPDFTNPLGRAWWARYIKSLVDVGVDGIWNDMNEPLYFGTGRIAYPPDAVRHDKEGLSGDHRELHNVYGMQMGRASREGLAEHRPGLRPFNIIRAGYAGAQRYASSWTGDNWSTWDQVQLSISMCLNMAMSGISFTGPDLGGFLGNTTGELLARWMQACVLFPFYRNHTAKGSIAQEPYAFDEATEHACRQALELRYQLLPYLYSRFADCHFEGLPILRPIFTAEPENAALRDIDDCYLAGEQILVAPILNAHTLRRTLYLPRGTWYDFYTNQRIEGGQIIRIEAPLDKVPLFIKAGSVIPMGPIRQHTDEDINEMVLRVYPGDGRSVIYEDAGEGYAYQDGQYRRTVITCTLHGSELDIEKTVSGRYEPPYATIAEVVRHSGEITPIRL